jgi:hypothetical protein
MKPYALVHGVYRTKWHYGCLLWSAEAHIKFTMERLPRGEQAELLAAFRPVPLDRLSPSDRTKWGVACAEFFSAYEEFNYAVPFVNLRAARARLDRAVARFDGALSPGVHAELFPSCRWNGKNILGTQNLDEVPFVLEEADAAQKRSVML